MIRRCESRDFQRILTIINDGARAYHGTVPIDCLTEPYMSGNDLQCEIDEGVVFWGYEEHTKLLGVMGLQEVRDVTLIRHAYVRTDIQRSGIGGQLLSYLRDMAMGPILIGTWADAVWAIRFYEKYGFQMVNGHEKDILLKEYWTVSQRQIEESVVLADPIWWKLNQKMIGNLD